MLTSQSQRAAAMMSPALSLLNSFQLRSIHSSDVLCWRASMKASALASVKLFQPKLMEYNRESQYSGVKQQKGWCYDTYTMSFRVVLALMAEAKAAALASVKLLPCKLMEYNRESQCSGVK